MFNDLCQMSKILIMFAKKKKKNPNHALTHLMSHDWFKTLDVQNEFVPF